MMNIRSANIHLWLRYKQGPYARNSATAEYITEATGKYAGRVGILTITGSPTARPHRVLQTSRRGDYAPDA